MKKRGFGAGKWNGFGGKVEAHETVVQGALRELAEESELVVQEADMVKAGTLLFHWRPEEQPVPWEVSVFTCSVWTGVERETEEMKPAWFAETEVPYHLMWEDDKHWCVGAVPRGRRASHRLRTNSSARWPHFLAGKRFEGRFFFEDTDKLVTYELSCVE